MKKYFVVFLLGSALAGAADFVTGQAARAIFGQQTFTAQDIQPPCQGTNTFNCTPPTAFILGAVGGIAYANNTLFVTDSTRVSASPLLNRVVIYTSISDALPPPTTSINVPGPNFVRCPLCLGTTDTALHTKLLGGNGKNPPDYVNYYLSATAFRTPTAVATDGNILVVADTDNNRVLIWKSVAALTATGAPDTGMPADIVLGQADFTTVKPVTVAAKSFRDRKSVV